MGKTKKILSTFVLFISLFFVSITQVEAATGTVTISANKSQIVVGNSVTFTVTVKAPKNEKLGAFQYNLSYDSSMLTLTSGDVSGAPPFTGNETSKTFTFSFKAKKSGTATVKFNISGGYNWDEQKITFSSPSKSIKIITQAQLEASYSSNNKLSSLGVEGYSLSPSFSSSITSYTVNLPANTESINITGKKSDSSASVEGLGTKTVVDGTNTLKIKVTAENGSTKTYTITAIVEELNPINITVNEKEYTVIRKAKLLTSPNSEFIESTSKINDEEVPTLYNEKANITLVGLKDTDGNIELYIYNDTNNTYTKYNQQTFEDLTLYIEDKEITNSSKKEQITIDEKPINAYTIKNDSYYYFYAINLSTGIESIYRYDNVENTVQRYIEEKEEIIVEEKENTNENEELYKYIIIGLLGFIFLTYIIILLHLIFGKKDKKKKANNDIIINKVPEAEELTNEEKEIHEEIERIGTQELQLKDIKEATEKKDNRVSDKEKHKLQKESEEELKRIKEDNTSSSNEVNNTINEIFNSDEKTEEKTDKKTKSRKKKNKKD